MATENNAKRQQEQEIAQAEQPAHKKQKSEDATAVAVVAYKPPEYDVVTPYFAIDRCADAIAHFKAAFDAKESVRMGDPSGGQVWHAELEIYGRRVMMSDMMPDASGHKTALALGGCAVVLVVHVPDVDAAMKKAMDAGCTLKVPTCEMFMGARVGAVTDKFGHQWNLSQQKRELSPQTIQERFTALFGGAPGSATSDPDLTKNDPPAKDFKPANVQTITPYLVVRGARDAMEWYAKAFGAREEYRILCPIDESKEPTASEKLNPGAMNYALVDMFDGGKVYLCAECPEMGLLGPATLGAPGATLCAYVADVDAAFKKAIDAGAKVVKNIETQFYGDKSCMIEDPFGHKWTLATHVEDVTPEEMEKRMAAMGPPPEEADAAAPASATGETPTTMQQ